MKYISQEKRLQFAFLISFSFHVLLILYSIFIPVKPDQTLNKITILKEDPLIQTGEYDRQLNNKLYKDYKNNKRLKSSSEKRFMESLFQNFKKDSDKKLSPIYESKQKDTSKKEENLYKRNRNLDSEKKIPSKLEDSQISGPRFSRPDLKRKLIFDPALVFPGSVRNKGINAKAKISAKISADGTVHGIEFIESSGHSALDLSISKQVRGMKFSAKPGSETVEFIRNYSFSLKSN